MAIDEKMTLQLEVNMRNYTRAMTRAGLMAQQAADRIERRFKQADTQVSGSFRNMARAGVAAFAVLAAAGMVRRVVGGLIEVSDTYQGLTNQVNSASAAVGHNLATMEEIGAVARRSRTSLQGTTMLYTRLERSAANLNMTQEQTLRITELVGMSFAASGATIQEQRSSILQLSQALQSGILQGDELRSLREGAPEIARAIATQMGVGIGALKDLGSQGLITADVVMTAILNAGTTIERQFNATHMTVAQAMENLKTAFTMAVGSSEEAGGATGALAEAIDDFATAIDDNKEGIASFVELLGDVAEAGVHAAGGIGKAYAAANEWLRLHFGTEPQDRADATTAFVERLESRRTLRGGAYYESLGDEGRQELEDAIAHYRESVGSLTNAVDEALAARLMLEDRNATYAASAEGFVIPAPTNTLPPENPPVVPVIRETMEAYLERFNAEHARLTAALAAEAEAGRLAEEAAAEAYATEQSRSVSGVMPRFAPRLERDAARDAGKNEALQDFVNIREEQRAANKAEAMQLGIDQAEAFERTMAENREKFSQEFGDVFASGMMAAFDGNLSEFLQRQLSNAMYDAMSDAFSRIGGQVFDSLFGGGGGSGGGGIGGFLGSMFGGGGKGAGIKLPGKALGGPVRANQPYVVGEHGPELMIPDKAGRIVPRLQSGNASAMITYSPNYVIDARGSTPDAIAALRREMAATRQADLQQFGTRVRGVLPGALASAQRDGAV